MVKLTKIKFPNKQLAFTLSAALLISLMPITSSAAENSNMEVPSIDHLNRKISKRAIQTIWRGGAGQRTLDSTK